MTADETGATPASPPRTTPLAAPRTAEEIVERFRGAIRSGQLGDGERLPTVRQTARDFGVAQATSAKAYRALEQEGLVVTRTAAGTRVAPGASRAPAAVVERARELAEIAGRHGVGLDDAVAVLRAIWAETDSPQTSPHPVAALAPPAHPVPQITSPTTRSAAEKS